MSLNLTAGSWIVFARLNASHVPGTVASTRLECTMAVLGGPALDFSKMRLAANNSAEALVFDTPSMVGAATLAAAGTVTTTCGSTNGTAIEVITARMTAIKVGTITTQ
jgi:hypothetical protein